MNHDIYSKMKDAAAALQRELYEVEDMQDGLKVIHSLIAESLLDQQNELPEKLCRMFSGIVLTAFVACIAQSTRHDIAPSWYTMRARIVDHMHAMIDETNAAVNGS